MKTDWDKKAVEILKKRDAKDPVIKMMLHWASVFLKLMVFTRNFLKINFGTDFKTQ